MTRLVMVIITYNCYCYCDFLLLIIVTVLFFCYFCLLHTHTYIYIIHTVLNYYADDAHRIPCMKEFYPATHGTGEWDALSRPLGCSRLKSYSFPSHKFPRPLSIWIKTGTWTFRNCILRIPVVMDLHFVGAQLRRRSILLFWKKMPKAGSDEQNPMGPVARTRSSAWEFCGFINGNFI